MDVIELKNFLRLEGPYNEDLVPTASEEMPHPKDMSLLIRKKLLIRGRTLGRNLVKGRNL